MCPKVAGSVGKGFIERLVIVNITYYGRVGDMKCNIIIFEQGVPGTPPCTQLRMLTRHLCKEYEITLIYS